MMTFLELFIFAVLLFAIAHLTLLQVILHEAGLYHFQLLVSQKKIFFFYPLFQKFFPKNPLAIFSDILAITRLIFYILYAGFLFLLALHTPTTKYVSLFLWMVAIDFFVRVSAFWLFKMFKSSILFFSSLFLSLFFPITGFFCKIKELITQKVFKKDSQLFSGPILQDKILNLFEHSGLNRYLTASDQNLVASFITFREKVAREIMIPKVDLFCLPSSMPIEEAAQRFVQDDYSRVPVYKESSDQIIGVLMYKDVLKIFAQNDKNLLHEPIETLIKPVLYAPENKKIAHLFQDFRKKKTHIAIIVDEYGGTEGIVTIEDILEELVGEIEDEYDILDEKKYFWKLPSGSYIVDAKMNLLDVANKLSIQIPQSPEYETIGGYIFHVAGTIPSKGWSLFADDFKLEVLISSDRCIEKIKVTPVKKEEIRD